MTKKNLIKIFSLLLIVFLTVTMSACGNKTTYTNSLERIKAQGKIVLGTSADYPPYEFHKEVNGKDTIVGFDIDIAQQVADDLGVQLVVKDMDFGGLLNALDAGNIDFVVAGMTPTPDREANVDFSEIYYTAVQTIVVRKSDELTLTSLDALNGKKIGVQQGSIQVDIANGIAGASVKTMAKIPDLILQLENNDVDAVILEKPVADNYVAVNNDLVVSSITLEQTDTGSAIAVKKGSSELTDAINQTLDRLIQNNLIEQYVATANEEVDN